ncbi:glycosyltransferase [Herpetosiphon llansteffanensis]|uniref:glycosyltransferase n=1 Tax=Herpetosiphon llansteffanensis TaxID=2094568 RepID=UPI000D7C04DD|nr:nucleotide disphospho-sugar-binding domain-containing protein [Herpetosiphon llansteffanensis]
MRALFVLNPGIGHLNPMLPVAQVLQEAGHDVAFAVSAKMLPSIVAKGFNGFPAGLEWLSSEMAQTFPEIFELPFAEQGQAILGSIFADAAAHAMVADLLNLGKTWQPDIIVRNDFEFGSCVAAELLGIPQATISISYFLSANALESLIGEELAYLRSTYGLAPYPTMDMLYPALYLAFAPPSFQPKEIPTMESLRPLRFTRFSDGELPAWVAQLPDRPTVYASMSSVFDTPTIFPMILEALRDEPINLILTVGTKQDPAQFGPQPANVYIEQYIPQALLFPHCDLFITHCPFATIMSAISHGMPLLMIPVAGEEPAGAMRAAELGLGKVLRLPNQPKEFFDQWVPEFSVESIRASVRELLQSPRYRSNAQRFQAEIRELPGPERVIELLTNVAQQRSLSAPTN